MLICEPVRYCLLRRWFLRHTRSLQGSSLACYQKMQQQTHRMALTGPRWRRECAACDKNRHIITLRGSQLYADIGGLRLWVKLPIICNLLIFKVKKNNLRMNRFLARYLLYPFSQMACTVWGDVSAVHVVT